MYKLVDSDWSYDFRIINMQDSDEKGVCYSQTKPMDESLIMEVEQEHELIKRISWVLNDWVYFDEDRVY